MLPVFAALVLYAPTFRYEPHLDDIHQVTPTGVAETRGLGDVWSKPYWGTAERGRLFRRILSTTFWLEGKVDLPLPARHAVNVLPPRRGDVSARATLLALGLGRFPPALAGSSSPFIRCTWRRSRGWWAVRNSWPRSGCCLALASTTAPARAPRDPRAVAARLPCRGTKASAWPLPSSPPHSTWRAAAACGRRGPRGRGTRSGSPRISRSAATAPGVAQRARRDGHAVRQPAGGAARRGARAGRPAVVGLDLVHLVFPVRTRARFLRACGGGTGSVLDPRLWGGVLLLGAALAAARWGGCNLALPGALLRWSARCGTASGASGHEPRVHARHRARRSRARLAVGGMVLVPACARRVLPRSVRTG